MTILYNEFLILFVYPLQVAGKKLYLQTITERKHYGTDDEEIPGRHTDLL